MINSIKIEDVEVFTANEDEDENFDLNDKEGGEGEQDETNLAR